MAVKVGDTRVQIQESKGVDGPEQRRMDHAGLVSLSLGAPVHVKRGDRPEVSPPARNGDSMVRCQKLYLAS